MITTLSVWIRLPALPLEYWNNKALLKFTSRVGNPIRVDIQMKSMAKGSFSRECVQIDATKPLIPSTIGATDKGRWILFVYEVIREMCFVCRKNTHTENTCARKLSEGQTLMGILSTGRSVYGPWILVDYKGTRQ